MEFPLKRSIRRKVSSKLKLKSKLKNKVSSFVRGVVSARPGLSGLTVAACVAYGPLVAMGQAVPAKAPTAVTLAVLSATGGPVSTVAAGSPVTLTASVTGNGNKLVHGLVRFCDAAVAPKCTFENKVGEAQLTRAGMASVKLTPGSGSHSYTAVFYPQVFFATAASAVSVLAVTTPGTSSTTIAESGAAGNYTLTATVVTKGLSTAPTGTVSFLDASANNKVIGAAPLLAGVGTGSLGFGGISSFVTGLNPGLGSVATGDFNHDGKMDFAVIGSNDYAVSIMLGNGDGTFTAAANAPIANNGVYQLKVADFNQDGNPDLVLVNQYNNELDFLLGNGDGTFKTGTSIMAGGGPVGVTLGDFNGDGILDILRTNTYGGTETLLTGNGDGTFTSGWQYYTSGNPVAAVTGDFNGDGIMDFAAVLSTNDAIAVFLGAGDGTFNAAAQIPTGNLPGYLVTGDFNGDGKVDLAFTNETDNTVSSYAGNGDGTFTLKQTIATPVGTTDVVMGDLNGDGVPDLVVSSSTAGLVTLLTGKGDGTFSPSIAGAAGVLPYQIALADFNGDGVPDVVAAGNQNSATVLLTQAAAKAATATLTGAQVAGTGTHAVTASYSGDLNFGSSVSATTSLIGKALNTVMLLYPSQLVVTAGQQVALTAVLSPFSSGSTVSNGETVTYLVDGKVVGSAVLNSGSATLNTTSLAAGIHVLTSSYGGDASFTPATGVNFILVFPKW